MLTFYSQIRLLPIWISVRIIHYEIFICNPKENNCRPLLLTRLTTAESRFELVPDRAPINQYLIYARCTYAFPPILPLRALCLPLERCNISILYNISFGPRERERAMSRRMHPSLITPSVLFVSFPKLISTNDYL